MGDGSPRITLGRESNRWATKKRLIIPILFAICSRIERVATVPRIPEPGVRTAGDGYNSHWPMVGTYVEMLAVWHRQGRPLRLSRRQFDEILAERSRPVDALTRAAAQ